jgi:hypothetical protein
LTKILLEPAKVFQHLVYFNTQDAKQHLPANAFGHSSKMRLSANACCSTTCLLAISLHLLDESLGLELLLQELVGVRLQSSRQGGQHLPGGTGRTARYKHTGHKNSTSTTM